MRKRIKDIRVRTTETEYNKIVENAKKYNMQVAPYIRMVAQNPIINQINYKALSDHTKEIAKVRESINHLIFSIDNSNNYLPKEIDSIVEMMNEIFESENKLLETLRKERTRQYDKDRKSKK